MDKTNEPGYVRIDFSTEVISIDEETGVVYLRAIPNPERYESFVKSGELYYEDKFSNYIFSQNMLDETAPQMIGKSFNYLPPRIDSASEYADERQEAVQIELQTGSYRTPKDKPAPHSPIQKADMSRDFVFISLDICDSTKLRLHEAEKFDQALNIFLRELGTVVGQFEGAIYKTTGDGFIAYMNNHSVNCMCDNAVDMCLTLMRVLKKSLNPSFKEQKLPTFNLRIGAECGEAKMKKYENPATGYEFKDLTSDALNRAVKIQESCEPDQILIGASLYERIHIQWLKRCSPEKDLGQAVGLPNYQLYNVN